MRKIKKAIFALMMLAVMAGLVVYSEDVSAAVLTSIRRCIQIIIPSLFAFMAMSRLAVNTGAAYMISVVADKPLQLLLGIPRGGAFIFLISNIAGYPVGAAMLAEMTENGQLEPRSAEAMSIYCYAAGPAFLINAVGVGVFGSYRAGLVFFLSIISANVLLAGIVNRIYRPVISETEKRQGGSTAELFNAVSGAGEAVLQMCLIIVFFSALISAAEAFGVFEFVAGVFGLNSSRTVLLRAVFEVTNLSGLEKGAVGYLQEAAVICGCGGVCVLMQVASVIRGRFSMKPFFKWLPVRLGLVYLFARLYSRLLMDDFLPVFSKNDQIIVELDNFIPSLCLIMMIFILVLQKRLDFFKRV